MKYLKNKIIRIIIILILNTQNFAICQNVSTIKGTIKGLGTGKKIFLGNKPNGITQSFLYVKFDSTYSKNDSFEFKNVKFKYPNYYSIEIENVKGWKSFFIDKGIIKIIGNADSIYMASVKGSKNYDMIKFYYNGLYKDWNITHNKIINSLNNEKDSIKNKKIFDTVLLSINILKTKTISFYDSIVKDYPYVAFNLLRTINLTSYSDSFIAAKFALLPKNVQKSEPLEDIYYRLNSQNENTKLGKKIPDFTFQSISKKINLYSYKSKYKLLVFGASWCGPCIEEIPLIESIYSAYNNKVLTIIAINIDNNEEKWKTYRSYYKSNIVQLYTGSPSISKIYKYFGISTIPYLILLDEKNKIIKLQIKLEEIKKYID